MLDRVGGLFSLQGVEPLVEFPVRGPQDADELDGRPGDGAPFDVEHPAPDRHVVLNQFEQLHPVTDGGVGECWPESLGLGQDLFPSIRRGLGDVRRELERSVEARFC